MFAIVLAGRVDEVLCEMILLNFILSIQVHNSEESM